MSACHDDGSPVLSIVIPTHQRSDLLRRCLASVIAHAPTGTEIIVVDDASPDESAQQAVAEFPGIRLIRLPSRRGFCVAANRGIQAARAPIVELLNDDTEVEPGWADAAMAWFQDPKIVAVAPLVLRHGSVTPTIDSAGDTYHWGGFAQKRGNGRALSDFPLEPREVFGASGSSAFYRRQAILDVGSFPESFGSYFEDVDLSFRLRRAGGRIVFDPRSRVWHHVGASHGCSDPALLVQQSRNEELVFWRNIPGRLLPAAFWVHLGVLAAKSWRRWREGRLIPFWRGRVQAAAQLPAVFRHRWSVHRVGTTDASVAFLDRDWVWPRDVTRRQDRPKSR